MTKSQKAKVLIVDDDKMLTSFLSLVMKIAGFQPLQAYCGREALKKLRSRSPALMLLDIRLPDINGLEVLIRVKGLDPKLRVIVMTGHYDAYGAAKAIKAGAYDYLYKPFGVEEVVTAVRRASDDNQQLCLPLVESECLYCGNRITMPVSRVSSESIIRCPFCKLLISVEFYDSGESQVRPITHSIVLAPNLPSNLDHKPAS